MLHAHHTCCASSQPILACYDSISAALAEEPLFTDVKGVLTAQVSAWAARGKLPLGADMTAAIQRMRLKDAALTGAALSLAGQPSLNGRSVSAEQESMLRMQYAMAIIRLVNGISDSAQKGTVAKSVAHLAETAGVRGAASQHCCSLGSNPLLSSHGVQRDECRQHAGSACRKYTGQRWHATAGLPRILVDVRHEASHNELPSLALLRLAAGTALAWLAHSYWQAQADHVTLRKAQIVELIKVWFGLCKPSSYHI